MIYWLDGYAALSCVDPVKIDRLAKSEGSSIEEVQKVWSEVREDVREIASLPGSSKEIVKASRYLSFVRAGFTLMGVGIIAIFLLISSIHIFPIFQSTTARFGLLIAVAIGYYIVFFVYFLLSRRLTRLVANHYEKHKGELARQRKHIKAATQRLIDVLAMLVRASEEENPEKYKLKMLHDDYSNIHVIGKRNGGRGRRNEFIAVVKGRSTVAVSKK